MFRIFVLSPANSGGERAALIYNPRARFDLAHKLQRGELVPLGEVFSFLSGLYFRGKFTYAQKFGAPPARVHPAYVITSNAGLMPATEKVGIQTLRSFGEVPIDPREPRYLGPLEQHARQLARKIGKECQVVLLGSIGTKKYAEVLTAHFGERLLFPSSFVGRGDMSRGSLLLRSASSGKELDYVPVLGAVRHGERPEKLPPKSWGYEITSGQTSIG